MIPCHPFILSYPQQFNTVKLKVSFEFYSICTSDNLTNHTWINSSSFIYFCVAYIIFPFYTHFHSSWGTYFWICQYVSLGHCFWQFCECVSSFGYSIIQISPFLPLVVPPGSCYYWVVAFGIYPQIIFVSSMFTFRPTINDSSSSFFFVPVCIVWLMI